MNEIIEIKTRGGRSGRKIHRSYMGSSVLNCGHWLRVNASYFRVPDNTPVTCEKCMRPSDIAARG